MNSYRGSRNFHQVSFGQLIPVALPCISSSRFFAPSCTLAPRRGSYELSRPVRQWNERPRWESAHLSRCLAG
jgi:hypothetical protein